jgi:hypothetical protein
MRRKTPDSVSKTRQKLKQEIDTWKAGIKRAETPEQVAFGKARLVECRHQMDALKSQGMRKFWQKGT